MSFSKVIFLISGIVLGASSVGSTTAVAQDQDRDRLQDRLQDRVPDQDRTRDQLRDRDQVPDQDRTRDRLQDQTNTLSTSGATSGAGAQTQYGPSNVYGWQLMSAQERATYQNQMRNATSQQERDRIQTQHRKEMQQRARSRNMLLPGMSGIRPSMGTGMGGMRGGTPGGGRGGR